MKCLHVLVLCLCFIAESTSQSHIKYSKVNIPISENQNLEDLQKLGFSLMCGTEHVHTKNNESVNLVLDDREIQSLRTQKFSFNILEDDLSKKIEDRNKLELPLAIKALEELKLNQIKRGIDVGQDLGCIEQEWPVPSNFKLGSMGGMLTYTELLNELDEMATKFPNLISSRANASASLTTIEGRDIQYVRISDNPSVSESEPQVLYTALHHAREPVSMMSLIYFMWYLLENYATNPEIKSLLDHTELLFIPCINVDGYLYNESTNPLGGGYWRKNLRLNANGSYGVDLNRNYGYQWAFPNGGSSDNPFSQAYHGTSAFSEPETQIIKEFVEARNIITAFNCHTYANLNLYPWGYTSDDCADDILFQEMTEQMCWHNRYFYGSFNEALYPGAGISDDWFYGEQTTKNKILAWTPEVGNKGFWPSPIHIVPQSQDHMRMNLQLAAMASNYGVLNDLTENNFSTLNPTIDFSIQHLSNVAGSFTINITPISPEILSISNSSLTTSSLNNDEYDFLSTSMTLDPATPLRKKIIYEVTMSNGTYDIFTRQFSKQYNPGVVYSDSFEDGNNWVLGFWEIDESEGYKANGSLTDSENSISDDGMYMTILLPIDLSASQSTVLEYYAKWDISKNFDYAQVQVSTDNANWSTLCGTYTKTGTPDGRFESIQPVGEGVYDGIQAEWIREEFDISNYDGQSTVYIRFVHSGEYGGTHRDGIFIDDLSIYSTAPPHCVDGIQNFDETGIDCGGLDCVTCPTCSDGIQNAGETEIDCGGPNCPACPDCETITLTVSLDNFSDESSWEVVDGNGNSIVSHDYYATQSNGMTITETFCLVDGCYDFIFYDTDGDGICCSGVAGTYSLADSNGNFFTSNGNFGSSETTNFCVSIPMEEDCPYDLSLTSYPVSDSTYYAEHNISTDATVNATYNIVLSAGNEISIDQGFEVITGATFHALIGGCTQ